MQATNLLNASKGRLSPDPPQTRPGHASALKSRARRSSAFLPDDLPRAATIALNVGVVAGLYLIMRGQLRGFQRTGGSVERAPGPAGLATFVGGWVVTAAPGFLLVIVLTFLGSQVQAILAGTAAFGTTGSAAALIGRRRRSPLTSQCTTSPNLSREVKAGETIHVSLRRPSEPELEGDDLTLDRAADCVAGTVPPSTLSSGTYAFEFTTGVERLASGEIVITAP
jgi:hypothetical protein